MAEHSEHNLQVGDSEPEFIACAEVREGKFTSM